MIAVLPCVPSPDTPSAALGSDLQSVGLHAFGAIEPANLVQAALATRPDAVVCQAPHPAATLQAVGQMQTVLPAPVVVFTQAVDAQFIEQAAQAGVGAYVVNGYSASRLRSVVQLAMARFRQQQVLQDQLADLSQRFEERKLLDRAKGQLMRAQQVSEDEAFSQIRSMGMKTRQRLGDVARAIIDASSSADAVNRAGQLRMLSQRAVLLRALQHVGKPTEHAAAAQDLLGDCIEHIQSNLAVLRKSLSAATFGDLLDELDLRWQGSNGLKGQLLNALGDPSRLVGIDQAAHHMLEQADVLTRVLETAHPHMNLRIVNVSGRQRMISQRCAKALALAHVLPNVMPSVLPNAPPTPQDDIAAMRADLAYLQTMPLKSKAIDALLAQAGLAHERLQAMVHAKRDPVDTATVLRVAQLAEDLLHLFEQLTKQYELGMQQLLVYA